jgi:hypothetical protein
VQATIAPWAGAEKEMDVKQQSRWVPAFAGMTSSESGRQVFPSLCQVPTHLGSLSPFLGEGQGFRIAAARSGMTIKNKRSRIARH